MGMPELQGHLLVVTGVPVSRLYRESLRHLRETVALLHTSDPGNKGETMSKKLESLECGVDQSIRDLKEYCRELEARLAECEGAKPIHDRFDYRGYDLRPLIDEIAEGEGTSHERAREEGFDYGYDVPFGYGRFLMPPKPLSSMTLAEVREFQTAQINATKGHITGTKYGTSAVGRFQIMRKTLDGLRRILKAGDDQVFSPQFQDRCAVELLGDCGLDQWLYGEINDEVFQTRLAHIWRSIENPQGYYNSMDFEQPVGTTTGEIMAAFHEIRASKA